MRFFNHRIKVLTLLECWIYQMIKLDAKIIIHIITRVKLYPKIQQMMRVLHSCIYLEDAILISILFVLCYCFWLYGHIFCITFVVNYGTIIVCFNLFCYFRLLLKRHPKLNNKHITNIQLKQPIKLNN